MLETAIAPFVTLALVAGILITAFLLATYRDHRAFRDQMDTWDEELAALRETRSWTSRS